MVLPLNYDALIKMRPEMIPLINARNLLLMLLMLWLLVERAPRFGPWIDRLDRRGRTAHPSRLA